LATLKFKTSLGSGFGFIAGDAGVGGGLVDNSIRGIHFSREKNSTE